MTSKKNKKEFDYFFGEMGEDFSLDWNSKKLEFSKIHKNIIQEEILLKNLTNKKLTIFLDEHDIIDHEKIVILEPNETRIIEFDIDCSKIDGKHKSYLILKSENQKEKIPIKITHEE